MENKIRVAKSRLAKSLNVLYRNNTTAQLISQRCPILTYIFRHPTRNVNLKHSFLH